MSKKFSVGQKVICLKGTMFTSGVAHKKGDTYEITEANVDYFNVFANDYELAEAEEVTFPSMKPDAIAKLRSAYRGNEVGEPWASMKENKLVIVKIMYNLFDFPGLFESKNWCENNIFND